jgi:hypothetical protein
LKYNYEQDNLTISYQYNDFSLKKTRVINVIISLKDVQGSGSGGSADL